MNWQDKSLNILGLSETETAILDCITTAKSIQEIADETALSRTGINYGLGQLAGKGLVTRYKHGKRSLYVGANLPDLARKLENISQEIHVSSGGIKGARIRTSKEDEFVIHVGTKEIIPAYSRIASMNKNERVRGLQHHRSYKEIVEKASSKLLAEFNGAIIKNDIILDGILNEGAYKAYADEMKADSKKYKDAVESLEGRMADYHVFSDNFFNFDAEIWIFKTTTLIINWNEEVAIEITNANMTGFLKDMFEFVKMSSNKIDHNKKMRDLLEEALKSGTQTKQT
jgi:hypothetical protein